MTLVFYLFIYNMGFCSGGILVSSGQWWLGFLFRWVCVCVCVFKVSGFVFVCVCVCVDFCLCSFRCISGFSRFNGGCVCVFVWIFVCVCSDGFLGF